MRLPQPFFRLPLRFDVDRLQAEVAALPADAWVKHPNEIAGNTSLRLISADGGENDDVNGVMRPTAHLQRSPYLRQILSSFGVVWSRSRLMRLAPGATVPQHADINYHWFNRVRLHIPIVTRPEVRFYCDPDEVHMAAGEAWLFDNWRQHRVVNPTDRERIHFVADTTGSAAFWNFVLSNARTTTWQAHPFDPQRDDYPLTEQTVLAPVMSPAEIEMLVLDLRSELTLQSDTPELRTRAAQYHAVLEGFCKDWRQLYMLHGDRESGRSSFVQLREGLRNASRLISDGLIMRTNRVAAHNVLEGRVLRAALAADFPTASVHRPKSQTATTLTQPVFIVAAPRSGSTLFFETLASNDHFATFGDEAHWLVESESSLRPGPGGVDSNRLGAEHATVGVRSRMLSQIADRLQNAAGERVALTDDVRLLEKTPKNALRIPFFNALFPDARFIFLWRDPRESISSIIEAWTSGQWKTYNGLEGFDGPWSLLLPPGWRTLNGKPLESIAAFQWDAANRTALDDLATLSPHRWMALSYADFLSNPRKQIERACAFAGVAIDAGLNSRLNGSLPLSKYTHTPPHADKWRRNESRIESVLPQVELTWQRLKALR